MIENANQKDIKRTALDAARQRSARRVRATSDARPSRATAIAFSYARVSTKEQARTGGGTQGYSIPAQIDACRLKASQLGAVIEPEHEYIDAGESAKTADRDNLQRMLKDIKRVRPDYVIVHKIDRLARNRADDIAINLLLKKYDVTLISCSENIDDTPSGRLLYGLMAEIAQFYSGNLALEVMKGMVRKAEEGGTPFRAPLGYINRRETQGGVERSWVELDAERADIIRWCFASYATGDWTGIDLTLAARNKGLTSRPTADKPSKPIGLTTLYHILQNPYYMGVVSYRGIHYEGKHPVLVEPDVWLAVQDLLAAHAHRGEKDRIHPHYLRGTIYCSDCGGRLVYSENTGNGGTYPYYLCVKKKTKENNCTRGAMRVERIEAAIADFYRRFKLSDEQAEGIRQAVRAELAAQQAEGRESLKRAAKRRVRAQDERSKLLAAHYAGAIPTDLLADEMNRLTRELAAAEAEIKAAKATNAEIEVVLEKALTVATHCDRQYPTAPEHVRRQINQGFFEKLLIGSDGSVEHAELTEPFRPLMSPQHGLVPQGPGPTVTTTSGDAWVAEDGGEEFDHENTDRHMRTVGGVKQIVVVDLTWTWSKRQDLADQLRRVASWLFGSGQWAAKDPKGSVQTTAKTDLPRRVVDRLGEAAVGELIEARRAGAKLRELVDRYGISESSVKRLTSKARSGSL